MGKNWWQSKTIWVNVVAFLGTITGAFGVDLGLDPETQLAIVTAIMAIVNVVLRYVTKESIA